MPKAALICPGPSIKHVTSADIDAPYGNRVGINSAVMTDIPFSKWIYVDPWIPSKYKEGFNRRDPKPFPVGVPDKDALRDHLYRKYPWLRAGEFLRQSMFVALLYLMDTGHRYIDIWGADLSGRGHGVAEAPDVDYEKLGRWKEERRYLAHFIRAAKRHRVTIRRRFPE